MVVTLLASASQQQLYNISKKNGVDLSFPEWSGNTPLVGLSNMEAGISGFFSSVAPNGFQATGLVGSVLCLDFGVDIGLSDIHAPGQLLNSQLQITADFVNINQADTFMFTMYIVTVSEGIWTVENLNSINQIGVLSKEDVLNATRNPAIDYKSTDNIYGGDFVGKVKSAGKKVLAGLKSALPYARDVASVIGTVAPLLPLIGLGEEERGGISVGGREYADTDDYYGEGVMVGGRKQKMKKGGKMISRKELHSRLR